MKPEVIHSQEFVADAVSLIEREAQAAIAARGIFSLALSGGNTPKPVYEALAKTNLPWEKVLITFGDERCVPPEDEQSNYRMARLSLLDHIAIPAENVLRVEGERPPEEAAKQYQSELDARANGEKIFRHDLLLLGMGPDGHTASLFPGTEALKETERHVVANFVPKFDTWRITMTYPVLDAARHVCFLVSRKGKEDVLDQVLRGEGDYPCGKIQPKDGRITWLIGE